MAFVGVVLAQVVDSGIVVNIIFNVSIVLSFITAGVLLFVLQLWHQLLLLLLLDVVVVGESSDIPAGVISFLYCFCC